MVEVPNARSRQVVNALPAGQQPQERQDEQLYWL